MRLNRKIKYYLIRLLRIKSAPGVVSFGLVLGFFPNWYPTFGIGIIFSLALAKLFKVNIYAALIGAITGALIWPFLFLLNYKAGNLILNLGSAISDFDEADLESINLFYYQTKQIGIEFMFGALFNSLVFSIIVYFIVYIILKKYRTIFLKYLAK